MNKKEHPDLMYDKIVLAANLYYKSNLSQREIAQRLNVSRPWVSKLLSRAEDLGIVKIKIDSPISGIPLLESQLQQKYDLKHAGVIDTSDSSRDYLAMAAASYFVSKIQPEDSIGIGWGTAITRFLKQLPSLHLPSTIIAPMAGSFGVSFETLPNYNALQMAEKTGGTANILHVPAFCSSSKEYETLIANEHTKDMISMAEHSDIILTGIGTFSSSFLTRYHILSDTDINSFKQAGAIGDILLQFLDKDGNCVHTDLTERLIIADIFRARKNARCVIAIAEGLEKLNIIHTVLSLHLVDSFFTSQETASALLKLCDSSSIQ